MVGTFDPIYGQVEHLDGFVDSWAVARERSDDGRLHHLVARSAMSLSRLRIAIGLYCFVDPQLGRKVERAWVDTAADGSDHRPYWVELGH